MKNFKMRTTIAVFIFLVTTVCMVFLYFFANRSMSAMMKQSQIENLHTSLSAQTNIIREYVAHQEDLLAAYSQDALVLDFLKDPHNESKRLKAQAYTEKYYAKLDNWEGLYIELISLYPF